MIGFLRGKIVAINPPLLLLDVNGVGYELEAPLTLFDGLPDVNQELMLYTHFLVREDAQILYAFRTDQDKSWFRTLIKVNGIGAKLALTILSGMKMDEFIYAIREKDVNALKSISGIGKKMAERLIIEMKDRLDDDSWNTIGVEINKNLAGNPGTDSLPVKAPHIEAINALVALGYKHQSASQMVSEFKNKDLSIEEIIKLALQSTLKNK
ncbi:MAG: Holliday junction branch migration protein RuvA [Methylococcales bacterium]|nr:Holliday junction branch migration protein RuvA [Methylococcales bacterium]